MYLRHGAVVPHRVPISAQWKMNFWPAGVRVVRDFRAYEHFCNFYVFRNYQIDRTLVKRFLKKNASAWLSFAKSLRRHQRISFHLP